jgi:hypothetical protein
MSRLSDREYPPGPRSGRLLLRMPSSLHEDVAQAAAAEGVSLNQFICTTLAGAVQWQARDPPLRRVQQVRNEIAWDLWMERRRR